ncbi:MAG: hypothetical protein GY856_18125 [bacterium]|nr:hypothetical protein [bacterium]
MKETKLPDGPQVGEHAAGSGKEPYERPRITFREPMEAVAVVCGPPFGKFSAPCVAAYT